MKREGGKRACSGRLRRERQGEEATGRGGERVGGREEKWLYLRKSIGEEEEDFFSF